MLRPAPEGLLVQQQSIRSFLCQDCTAYLLLLRRPVFSDLGVSLQQCVVQSSDSCTSALDRPVLRSRLATTVSRRLLQTVCRHLLIS